MFIFAPLAEWLLARYGWRGANWIIAAIILNGVGCGALFRPLDTTGPKTSTVRGTLLERIRKERERRRTLSTGSLDGTLITRDNVFIKDRQLIRSILAPWENSRRTSSVSEDKTYPIHIPARRHSTKTFVACSNSPSNVQCSASLHTPSGSSLLHQPITVLGSGHFASMSNTGTPPTNFHTQVTCQPLKESEQHHADSNKDAVASPLVQTQSRTTSSSTANNEAAARQRASRLRVIAKREAARPLYRQDIFFSGSVTSIPEYRSMTDMASYLQSYTKMPPPGGERGDLAGCCVPLSSVLVRMLDFTLLRSFTFLTLCIAGVFAMTGEFF